MSTRRDRLEARAAKREQWAESAKAKQQAACEQARETAKRFEFGQPILVGHHSEKGARRDQAKMQGAMTRAHEAGKLAERHSAKAKGIARALGRTVFSDDPDAAGRLEARIAEAEAELARVKAINAALRKDHGTGTVDALKALDPTPEELANIRAWAQMQPNPAKPIKINTTNITARIRRDNQRLEALR